MSTAFDTAALAMFGDENFTLTGTYTPAGGSPVSAVIAVKVGARNTDINLSGSKANVATTKLRFLVVTIPTKPTHGATFVSGSVTYKVQSAAPVFRGCIWECEVSQ